MDIDDALKQLPDSVATAIKRRLAAPSEVAELDCPDAEIKALNDDEPGTFTGMAATFGNRDLVGDVIERGAFANSLRKFASAGRLPPLLWSHNMDRPIGRFMDMQETGRGLSVKGRINLNTTLGRETHALLKDGDIDGMSIGFRVPDKGAEFDDKRGMRRLKEIDLLEVSIVALPANDRARTRHVKDFSPETVRTPRELETALRDLGVSKADAAYIAAGWQEPARRDAEGESLKELLVKIERLTETVRSS